MLRLHFPNRPAADVPLSDGLCPVVRHASGQILAGVSAVGMLLLARFCLDGRGLWLQVSHEGVQVHVNGRPVRRMAIVRSGDQINIDGQDIHILGRHPHASSQAGTPALLRGYGGHLHGRAFALDRNWVMGSSAQADIVLEDKSLPALFVRIQPQEGTIDLQVLPGGEPLLVNGQACLQAALLPGDQVVLPQGVRLVVEAAQALRPLVQAAEPPHTAATTTAASTPAVGSGFTSSWLLLAALTLAAGLTALLLFGPR